MKKLILGAVASVALLAACEQPADVASRNLSVAADNFEIVRRVVFYNGITDTYILTIEGRCSIGNYDSQGKLSVTCKESDGQYKKHFLGLSDNVTFFAEQMEVADVSTFHTRVTFRPQTIVPDIDLQVDAQEMMINRNGGVD